MIVFSSGKEYVHSQSRLTRCAQQCQDDYNDSVPSGEQPTAKDTERAQQCLVKCCDTHSQLIPKLMSKYAATLKNCRV